MADQSALVSFDVAIYFNAAMFMGADGGRRQWVGHDVADDWLLTIFVSGGQSRKLASQSDAADAIAQGLLGPETKVLVRLSSGERVQSRAIEVEQLAQLLPKDAAADRTSTSVEAFAESEPTLPARPIAELPATEPAEPLAAADPVPSAKAIGETPVATPEHQPAEPVLKGGSEIDRSVDQTMAQDDAFAGADPPDDVGDVSTSRTAADIDVISPEGEPAPGRADAEAEIPAEGADLGETSSASDSDHEAPAASVAPAPAQEDDIASSQSADDRSDDASGFAFVSLAESGPSVEVVTESTDEGSTETAGMFRGQTGAASDEATGIEVGNKLQEGPDIDVEPRTTAAMATVTSESAAALAFGPTARTRADHPDSSGNLSASDAPADDWAYRVPPKSSRVPVVTVLAGVLLIALLIAGSYFWFRDSPSGGERYLLTDVQGFETPGGAARSGDRLTYGQMLQVEHSEVEGWLRIVEGPYAGLYLPTSLLGRETPPELDRSAAGDVFASQTMSLRSGPDDSSESIASIALGESRFAQGTVRGGDGTIWYLFLLEDRGLPTVAFGRRDYALASADEVSAAVGSERLPDSDEPIRDEVRPAEPRNSCATIRNRSERLACEDPGLRDLEADFSAAYSRAAARFANAGQGLPPIARFAARIQQCNTARCARARYNEQVLALDAMQPTETTVVPSPSVARVAARDAVPRGDPSNWIRSDDYPSRALRDGTEGAVRFTLRIGSNGRVTSCQVTGSSGSAVLDEATCRLVSRRARFNPAIDSSGSEAEGSFSSTVRWRLPQR